MAPAASSPVGTRCGQPQDWPDLRAGSARSSRAGTSRPSIIANAASAALRPLRVERLPHRRQRRRGVTSLFHVVEADDGDVVRNADTATSERLETGQRHGVVRRDQSVDRSISAIEEEIDRALARKWRREVAGGDDPRVETSLSHCPITSRYVR